MANKKDINKEESHDDQMEEELAEMLGSDNVEFTCPNCGVISQDDVVFLCNTCSQDELLYKDGVYMCPACLEPGENFECMNCESKEVTMRELEA